MVFRFILDFFFEFLLNFRFFFILLKLIWLLVFKFRTFFCVYFYFEFLILVFSFVLFNPNSLESSPLSQRFTAMFWNFVLRWNLSKDNVGTHCVCVPIMSNIFTADLSHIDNSAIYQQVLSVRHFIIEIFSEHFRWFQEK